MQGEFGAEGNQLILWKRFQTNTCGRARGAPGPVLRRGKRPGEAVVACTVDSGGTSCFAFSHAPPFGDPLYRSRFSVSASCVRYDSVLRIQPRSVEEDTSFHTGDCIGPLLN